MPLTPQPLPPCVGDGEPDEGAVGVEGAMNRAPTSPESGGARFIAPADGSRPPRTGEDVGAADSRAAQRLGAGAFSPSPLTPGRTYLKSTTRRSGQDGRLAVPERCRKRQPIAKIAANT